MTWWRRRRAWHRHTWTYHPTLGGHTLARCERCGATDLA